MNFDEWKKGAFKVKTQSPSTLSGSGKTISFDEWKNSGRSSGKSYRDIQKNAQKQYNALKKYSDISSKYNSFLKDTESYLSRGESNKYSNTLSTVLPQSKGQSLKALAESGKKPEADLGLDRASSRKSWKDEDTPNSLKKTNSDIIGEAKALLESLEDDRQYMTDERYNAYKEYLTNVAKGDFSDAIDTELDLRKRFGTEGNYREAVATHRKNQRLGITSYTTWGDLNEILSNEDLDEKDREYIEKLANSRDYVNTMTVDEVRAKVNERSNELKEISKSIGETNRKSTVAYRSRGLSSTSSKDFEDAKAKQSKLQSKKRRTEEEQLNDYAYYDDYGNPVTWEEYLEILEAREEIDNIEADSRDYVKEALATLRGYYGSENHVKRVLNEPETETKETEETEDLSPSIDGPFRIDPLDPSMVGQLKKITLHDANGAAAVLRSALYDPQKIIDYYTYNLAKEIAFDKSFVDEQFAKEHEFLATLLQIGSAPVQAVEYVGNVFSGDGGELARRANVYDDRFTNMSQTFQTSVAQEIDDAIDSEFLSWVATNAYSGVTSSFESLTLTAACTALTGGNLAAGSNIALAVMGSKAAANAYNQAIKTGSSYGQALTYSFAAGFNEVIMEKAALDNLFKNAKNLTKGTVLQKIKAAIKGTAMQGVIEGAEELGTELLNGIADGIINGDLSQYNASIQRYMMVDGLSRAEAEKKASGDYLMQIIESVVGGFIGGTVGSGGVVQVGKALYSPIKQRTVAKNTGRDIIESHGGIDAFIDEVQNRIGLDNEANTELLKKIEKLKVSEKNARGKYSASTLRLANEIWEGALDTINRNSNAKRTQIIENKLKEKGLTEENAAKISEEIASSLKKESSVEALKTKFEGNEAVLATIDELTNEESDSFDASLYDSQDTEQRAIMELTLGREKARAYFDNDYAEDSGRIDEAKTELGEIVRFEEITNEDGDSAYLPVIKVGEREVPLSDIELSADSIYRYANEKNSVESANEMIGAYKKFGGGINADTFAKEWNYAYQMGRANRNGTHTEFLSHDFTIPREAAENARAFGEREMRRGLNEQKNDIKRAQRKKTGREGTISTEDVQNKKLITEGIERISKILSLAGYNIRLFEDTSENADRGSYSWETNTINLNVAVGSGRGAVDLLLGRTLSHELTHSIQRWNPEGYEELKGFIIDKMGDSFESMVYQRMNDFELDRADAIDEVVAYSCEMMLRDSKALGDFAKGHRTLFEKICDIVDEFIKKIRSAIASLYGEIGPDSQEARFMELYADELQMKFDKALSDALNASEATVNHDLQSNANKKAAEDGGNSTYRDLLNNGERSKSGHIYKKGRKPTRNAYMKGLENFFKPGEQRLAPNANGGYTIEAWDGKGWIEYAKISEKVQYAKGKSSYDEWDVQTALYDALDHEDRRNEHLIRVGTMPKYIVDKLGIDGDFYIYRNHIYENMVSKEQAIEGDRYVEGRHYHDLGFEITEAAIMALENPILSIATKTSKNNPAVAMILPVKGKNGIPLYSVMSFYSEMSVNGNFSRKPHVVLSIYEMDMVKKNDGETKKPRDKSLEEIVEHAVKDGKVFDLDKKMRDALSVIAERTRLGDITETSLKESLSQFRKEIKTFKEKNKIQYSRGEENNSTEIENISAEDEADIAEYREARGISLTEALKLTAETDEERAKIAEYEEKEQELNDWRAERSKLEVDRIKLMAVEPYSPKNEKIRKAHTDAVKLRKAIRSLERARKTVQEKLNGQEYIILDDQEENAVKRKAKAEIAKTRRDLTEIERQISAKNELLKKTEATINDTKFTKELNELDEKIEKLDRSIRRGDQELLQLRSTEILKTLFAKEKAKAIEATKALMKRRQEESAVRQKKTSLSIRALNEIRKIEELASRPTAEKHIPSTLATTIKAFSQAVPGREIHYDERIAELEKRIKENVKRRKKLYELREKANDAEYRVIQGEIDFLKDRITKDKELVIKNRAWRDSAADIAEGLKTYFDSLEETKNVYDPALLEEVKSISEMFKNEDGSAKTINELSLDELQKLCDLITLIKSAIRDAKKLYGQMKSLDDEGADIIDEANRNKDTKERLPWIQGLREKAAQYGYSMLKPYELFELTGSKTLCERFRKLQSGEGKYFRDVDEATKRFRDAAEKYHITKSLLETETPFTLENGTVISLSYNEAMSIYLTAQRHQGRVHLLTGGFRLSRGLIKVPGKKYYVERRQGESEEAFAKRKEKAQEAAAKKIKWKNSSSAIKVTSADIDKISYAITRNDKLKGFADTLQLYMSKELADKGNKTSLKLHDIKKFMEPDYFPLMTDSAFRKLQIDKATGEVQIIHKGFTKQTVPDAGNPLVIDDMTEVFGRHANEMALYNAFGVELENMKRVLNYQTIDGNGNSISVMASLGTNLSQEIVNFIREVNGGVRGESTSFADKLISLNKAAKVGTSLSVAIQQPSAICRAFAMIDPKYYLPGGVEIDRDGKLWDEMEKYTATAGIKRLGGVDINTSKGIIEEITDLGLGGRGAKANIDKVIQKASFGLAEQGDRIAWKMLWHACKREASESYSGEEILIRAGERFDEIINRTQVYDSVFSRSKWMRSKSTLNKMATAFMAEPITTANMVIQAVRDIKSGEKARIKAGIRSIGSVIVTTIVNAALVSFVYAMRDEDEDESYWQKYLESFLQRAPQDLINVSQYVPYLKDFWSVFQGYDVERMDLSLVGDLMDCVKKISKTAFDENATTEDQLNVLLDFSSKIFDLTGIPASNAVRDARAFLYTVGNADTKGTPQGWKEAALDGLFEKAVLLSGLAPSPKDADKLYRAIMSGDKARFKQIADRLDEEGKTTKQIQSLIVTGLKNNDERITDAAEARNAGNTAKYTKILEDIVKDGFAKSYVEKAVISKMSQMNKKEPEESEFGVPDPTESEEYYSIFDINDIYINLEAGDQTEAQIAIDDIYENKYAKALAELKDDEGEGDAERKALSSLRNMISGKYRDIYKASDEAERERIRELLLDIHVNGEQLYKEKTIDGWGEDD